MGGAEGPRGGNRKTPKSRSPQRGVGSASRLPALPLTPGKKAFPSRWARAGRGGGGREAASGVREEERPGRARALSVGTWGALGGVWTLLFGDRGRPHNFLLLLPLGL